MLMEYEQPTPEGDDMSECTQCPHTVGDSYQRDCGFPDCVGGWEEAHKDLATKLQSAEKRGKELIEVIREAYMYLNTNKYTSIGHGSILHQKFESALTGSEPIQGEKTNV